MYSNISHFTHKGPQAPARLQAAKKKGITPRFIHKYLVIHA